MLPRGAALPAAPRCLPDPRPSAAPSPRQVYAGINSSVDTYARTYDLLWKYGPQALRFPLRKANSVRFFSMFVTSQLFGVLITVTFMVVIGLVLLFSWLDWAGAAVIRKALIGVPAGGKCRPPCLTARPHPPAWCLPGLRPLPHTLERRLSSLKARRGLSSLPRSAPKLRMLRLQPPGIIGFQLIEMLLLRTTFVPQPVENAARPV